MISFNKALEFIQDHSLVVGFKNDGQFKATILKGSKDDKITDEEGLEMLVDIIASKTKIEVFNDMFIVDLKNMLSKYGILLCTD